MPILEKYGESTINNILRTTINEVVKSEFKNKNLDNMINIVKDNDNIELIDYNTQVINEILSDVTDKLLVSIKDIEISNIKNYEEENMYIFVQSPQQLHQPCLQHLLEVLTLILHSFF